MRIDLFTKTVLMNSVQICEIGDLCTAPIGSRVENPLYICNSSDQIPGEFSLEDKENTDCFLATNIAICNHKVYHRILYYRDSEYRAQDFYVIFGLDLQAERRKLEDSCRKNKARLLRALMS